MNCACKFIAGTRWSYIRLLGTNLKSVLLDLHSCGYYNCDAGKCGQQLRHASRGVGDPENTGKTTSGTNFDTMGIWNNHIDMPLLMDESIRRGTIIPKISENQVGVSSVLGRRTYQEDRCIVRELSIPGVDLLYFAVFDGHGGAAAADHAHTTFIDHLMYWAHRCERDFAQVLEHAFLQVNNSFARAVSLGLINSESANCGTTATVCLLENSSHLYVAHVGDSRAVINRNGKGRRLTTDHVPELDTERMRVIKSRGQVSTNSLGVPLVNGRLSMTRSIGDLELKPYGVTAMPEINELVVKHHKDAFMFLATDGVNFALSDQEVCDIISKCSSPQAAATFITDQAMQFGSEDNSTVLVIPFGSWGKYRLIQSDNVQFSFGRLISQSSRW